MSEQEKQEVIDMRALKSGEYVCAVGRRKTAVAQVRLHGSKTKKFLVNDRPVEEYFATPEQLKIVMSPFVKTKCDDVFEITVLVKGGGLHAQAEAIRLGISRALVDLAPSLRSPLKKFGFVKRDPRKKERKKFGLRGARRRPQWSKR